MHRLLLSAIAFAASIAAATSAHAQANLTWVSGVGDDANPCNRTAPCKTFAGAISKTSDAGEIRCLDPGGFGAVTITISITIDCHENPTGVLVAFGQNGITVNAAGKVVNLRNLMIDGITTGGRGISILAAAKVNIEDSLIHGFSQQGIVDLRTSTTGNMLVVKNTTVRNNVGAGIAVAGGAASGAVLDNVVSTNNGFGVAVGGGNNVVATRTTLSNNTTAGAATDIGAALLIEDSTISGNPTGIVSNAPVRVSGSTISFNTTVYSGGSISTNGNNRLFGNGSLGSTPTPAGSASSDLGLQ